MTTVVASADPFVEEVQRTRSWLSFPGTNASGWQLELRLATNIYLLQRPIEAAVIFKNVSPGPLRLFLSTPSVPYMFSTWIFDAAGKPVPMDDEAREHMEHGRANMGMFRDVAPGTSLGFSCELQQLYRFGRPGFYKLRATARWLPNAHWTPGPSPAPASTGLGLITLVSTQPSVTTTNK